MINMSRIQMRLSKAALWSAVSLIAISGATAPAVAQSKANNRPALIITNDPLPKSLKNKIYSDPVQVREVKAKEVSGDNYYKPTETLVTRKVKEIGNDLNILQNKVKAMSEEVRAMQKQGDEAAALYYADLATIRTQLQSGTTPGNPRLLERLERAEQYLGSLNDKIKKMNTIVVEGTNAATEGSFILDATRSAYSLSGAVEEDHIQLAEIEDAVSSTIVIVERVLNTVSQNLTRASATLSAERSNLRTLSLAVANGDLYGRSFSNQLFLSSTGPATAQGFMPSSQGQAIAQQQPAPSLDGPRPLVKIRFDRSDVKYEQPLYTAVNEALQRYPQAMFELVAVYPSQGNAAEIAIETTRARRNAEKVLRTLTQMGLPAERISLSSNQSVEAITNEVHLLIR